MSAVNGGKLDQPNLLDMEFKFFWTKYMRTYGIEGQGWLKSDPDKKYFESCVQL